MKFRLDDVDPAATVVLGMSSEYEDSVCVYAKQSRGESALLGWLTPGGFIANRTSGSSYPSDADGFFPCMKGR